MAKESSYGSVSAGAFLSSHRIRLILVPNGGAAGTGWILPDDFMASSLVQDAMLDHLVARLQAGTNITLDNTTDPTKITVIGAAGSTYTAENARDDIGAALRGETDFINFAADDSGDLLNFTISQTLKDRITALENSGSLIQVKDTLTAGGNAYMSLPGTSGNYVSTPDHADFAFSGNYTVALRVRMPASAPGAAQIWASQRGAAGNVAWTFGINTSGTLFSTVSTDGTATTTGTTTPTMPFDGNIYWVRVSRKVSDGTSDFQYAADSTTIPTSWTNLSINRATGAALAPFNSTATINISGYNNGTSSPFAGQVLRVMFFPSLLTTGTPIADANASDWTTGSTWTDPYGKVWTLNGTATVVPGGSNAIANTSAEFTLSETDAFAGILFEKGDTLMWSAEGTFINTSGSSVNFTPKLRMAGVDLFTWPAAIAVASQAAGQIYNWSVAARIESNAIDGTSQIVRAQLIINNNVTGTDAGSISMASNLANMSGNRSGTIATVTTIPNIQFKMTMGTAATTISSRSLLTQLFLAKG